MLAPPDELPPDPPAGLLLLVLVLVLVPPVAAPPEPLATIPPEPPLLLPADPPLECPAEEPPVAASVPPEPLGPFPPVLLEFTLAPPLGFPPRPAMPPALLRPPLSEPPLLEVLEPPPAWDAAVFSDPQAARASPSPMQVIEVRVLYETRKVRVSGAFLMGRDLRKEQLRTPVGALTSAAHRQDLLDISGQESTTHSRRHACKDDRDTRPQNVAAGIVSSLMSRNAGSIPAVAIVLSAPVGFSPLSVTKFAPALCEMREPGVLTITLWATV